MYSANKKYPSFKSQKMISTFIIQTALLLHGVHYRWAGNCPLSGLDCSGFVCEVFRSVGLMDNDEDLSAQGIYLKFRKNGRSQLSEGSLLFFGKSRIKITHVAIAINEKIMIEAGGGDRATETIDDAQARNAYVRIRPINSRGDLVAVLKVAE